MLLDTVRTVTYGTSLIETYDRAVGNDSPDLISILGFQLLKSERDREYNVNMVLHIYRHFTPGVLGTASFCDLLNFLEHAGFWYPEMEAMRAAS